MQPCYNCDTILTDINRSDEHILPNSCGGVLTSVDLICRDCNNYFGQSIDKVFAEQIEVFMNQLVIKKDRGKIQSVIAQDTIGREYIIDKNHAPKLTKPDYKITENGLQLKINVEYSNEKQKKQVLAGIERKYKNIGKLKVESETKYIPKSDPLVIKLSFDRGNQEIFKAILKIAINFYCFKRHETKFIINAINALKNSDVSLYVNNVFNNYSNIPIYVPKDNEISHILYIKGVSKDKIIYCYVELFNCLTYFVKLSDDYDGSDFEESYILELTEKKQSVARQEQIKCNLSYEELNSLLTVTDINFKELERRFQRIMDMRWLRLMDKKIKCIIDSTLGKYNGEIAPENVIGEFIDKVMNVITPNIKKQ